MGSQRAGHDWATNTHTHTHTHIGKTCDRNEGGRADRGQLTRGLEAVCGGSLYLTSLVHFLCHVCKFFLNISLMCIFFKKILPPTVLHDEIASSHAIPWKQERLSNNWLYPQWSPSFNSHLLALSTVFDFRSQKSVCLWGSLLRKA